MGTKIKLDITQEKAIDFLVNSILSGEEIVALLGAGGTGKTAILHKLSLENKIHNIDLTFTATTNKAASIMRKDIPDAITMHSAISKYIPTKLYSEIDNYFYVEGIAINGSSLVLTDDTLKFIEYYELDVENILSENNNVDEFFRNLGIDGYDPLVFSHYQTADYQGGVCIIDEASMLPTKSIYKKDKDDKVKLQTIGLDIINKIYDTIILVGDNSQLPPINGESSFEGVPSYHLTKNYRAEKDLLRLLEYARNGGALELFVPEKGENIRVMRSTTDKMMKASFNTKVDIVHIVYKNVTRKKITKMIRGNDPQPNDLEPIVYYGANINDPGDQIAKNEIGFYEDGYGEWDSHRQVISARHFDEYSDGRSFTYLRYGYALTCHSAQGSSFDHVVVHTGDIPGFIDKETQRKWLYTACSRARKSVVIIR